jgi:hypothetical protein
MLFMNFSEEVFFVFAFEWGEEGKAKNVAKLKTRIAFSSLRLAVTQALGVSNNFFGQVMNVFVSETPIQTHTYTH